MKLPRNKREFALFLLILSMISMNIIAPLITCFETGFSIRTWLHVFSVMPILWPCVILTVLVTYKPAAFLTSKVTQKGDSFKAVVSANIVCTVFLMSIILTIVGSWVGVQEITLEPIENFFYKWPRNFSISLATELLVAQPIARNVMRIMHKRIDARGQGNYANA